MAAATGSDVIVVAVGGGDHAELVRCLRPATVIVLVADEVQSTRAVPREAFRRTRLMSAASSLCLSMLALPAVSSLFDADELRVDRLRAAPYLPVRAAPYLPDRGPGYFGSTTAGQSKRNRRSSGSRHSKQDR